MKILFLNSPPIFRQGIPDGFKDLGHEIFILNTLRTNEDLEKFKTFGPDLIIMMGWSTEHTLTQFKKIRRVIKPLKIPIIYWSTEDPAHTLVCALPLIQTIQPDFIFTICKRKVNYFKTLGIKADYLDFGYHEAIHHRIPPCAEYNYPIVVVANAYTDYLAAHPDYMRNTSIQILIKPLIEQGIRVDFWGRDWEKTKEAFHFEIPPEYIHGYLEYEQVHKVYSSAAIVLGLQNKQVAMRTYEILGSGGFLLTHYTPNISQLFEHGKELLLSHSPDETIKWVQYYLQHPEQREKIRNNGYLAVQCHHYKYKAEYILKVLKQEGILPS